MGTLAPILLSLFILIRARMSTHTIVVDLAQLQDTLNVQSHLFSITANAFADMLNRLRTIDRSHTYDEQRNSDSKHAREDKIQKVLTERMHQWHELTINKLIQSLRAHQRKRREKERRNGTCRSFWLWIGRWFCCCFSRARPREHAPASP